MDHPTQRRVFRACIALASAAVAGLALPGYVLAQSPQSGIGQATCDTFAHSNLLEELDCLRAGHGSCRRTDLSTLFPGCSYEDEARIRHEVGLVEGTPLPTEAMVDSAHARAHPARYPLAAFTEGREETVTVTADVDADGRAISVFVAGPTEHPDLVRAAMEWVKTLRYIPAHADGRPVVGRVMVPVRFEIGGRSHVPDSGGDIPATPPGDGGVEMVP